MSSNGVVQVLYSDEVTLTHDQQVIIDQTVTLPDVKDHITIGIALEYESEVPDSSKPAKKSQSISYRTKVVGSRS